MKNAPREIWWRWWWWWFHQDEEEERAWVWYCSLGIISVALATRLDMLKKPATSAMSHISSSENLPSCRSRSLSTSVISHGATVSFHTKSNIVLWRTDSYREERHRRGKPWMNRARKGQRERERRTLHQPLCSWKQPFLPAVGPLIACALRPREQPSSRNSGLLMKLQLQSSLFLTTIIICWL